MAWRSCLVLDMRMTRRDLMLGVAFSGFAQEPKFSTEVKVVTLFAAVHDRDGTVITNLNKEDFLVEEDGVRQRILYFSRESDLPLTIGLLVDTSKRAIESGFLDNHRPGGPLEWLIKDKRAASYTFLDKVLREGKDRAFVAHFDYRVEILQDLTYSRTELESALKKLEVARRLGTGLFEAVRDCSQGQMRKQPGRKAFVILSDGLDSHDPTTITTAIEFAQRADVIIYSILFNEITRIERIDPAVAAVFPLIHAKGKHTMQRLAQETGGEFFELSKNRPIEQIYASIVEQLRTQYSIGYTPERKDGGGQYRKVRLTTRQPGLIVQTRAGYYAE